MSTVTAPILTPILLVVGEKLKPNLLPLDTIDEYRVTKKQPVPRKNENEIKKAQCRAAAETVARKLIEHLKHSM